MLIGLMALTTAAVFAGAAIYVSTAEHPARLMLPPAHALAQWKPAYERGALMQASLALAGFAFGLWQYVLTSDWLWLAGALLILANWPFTLLVIMPVNKALKATDAAAAGEPTMLLLHRWGALHVWRGVLGALSAATFLFANWTAWGHAAF
jgi:hypothetical protein